MNTHFLQGTLMFTTAQIMRFCLLMVILSSVELHATFTQSLTIKANSGKPVVSEKLLIGKKYRITFTGEFSIWPEQIGNGIDAAFVYGVPQSRIDNRDWPAAEYIDTVSGDTIAGFKLPMWVGSTKVFPNESVLLLPGLFDKLPNQLFNLSNWTGFRMNGNPISNDTSFDPINHQYQIEVSGQDKELTFAIIDSVYSFADSILKEDYANNSGEVNVLIEEVIPYFVNICSATPQLDPKDPTKMKGIKVDVSVLVQSSGNRNILFDKNQVAIYDNGKFVCPDTIVCNKTAESVSIAMLFDRSGSMTDRVSKEDTSIRIDVGVNSARNFVSKLTPADSVLLLSFSDTSDINLDVNWTTDKQRVQNSINGFTNRLNSTILQTALHRALITAISRTKSHSNRIKAIVALTDGANNVDPLNEEVVINALPASRNIPIYIIALGMDTKFDTTISDPTERLIDSLRAEDNRIGLIKMARIADSSRGKLFLITNSAALDSTYALISKNIREQECCSIEYPVDPCKEGTGDTVRTIVIYYPFEGGVAARSTSYKTSCATLLMGESNPGDESYSKIITLNSDKKLTSSTFELQLKKKGQVRIELSDEKGKKINSMDIKNLKKGANTVTLSTNGLPIGKYTAKVFAKGIMISQHEITIQE